MSFVLLPLSLLGEGLTISAHTLPFSPAHARKKIRVGSPANALTLTLSQREREL